MFLLHSSRDVAERELDSTHTHRLEEVKINNVFFLYIYIYNTVGDGREKKKRRPLLPRGDTQATVCLAPPFSAEPTMLFFPLQCRWRERKTTTVLSFSYNIIFLFIRTWVVVVGASNHVKTRVRHSANQIAPFFSLIKKG
jgi:hypothetical protein